MIRASVWIGMVLFSVVLVASAHAQPPERVRLDLTVGFLSAPKATGRWFGGTFVPGRDQGDPVDLLALFDLATTVNISSRISTTAGVPLALTFRPGASAGSFFEGPQIGGGVGDAHAEVSVVAIGERAHAPGLTLSAEAGAPTASLAFMGTEVWRTTGRGAVSKSLHPRFSLFADGSYSHFFEEPGIRIERLRSVGGGLAVGVTRASILTLHVEEVGGGKRTAGRRVIVPTNRDLHASIGITRYSRGRPRVSLLASAAGLRASPSFVVAVKAALVSR